MQILGSSPTYSYSAISSGMDSVAEGIVQMPKQDGMSFLDTAIDTFSFAQPGAHGLPDTNAPVSTSAEFPDPISFLGIEGGSGEILSVLNQPQFLPATELGSFSTQLTKFTTDLPKSGFGQEVQTLQAMKTTVDQIIGLQQSFDKQLQQAYLSNPAVFNHGKTQGSPVPLNPTSPSFDSPSLTAKAHRLFVRDGMDANEVDRNDVGKGRYGYDNLMAVIAAVARQEPELIKNMISENSDGTYTVTFKQRISDDPPAYEDMPVTITPEFVPRYTQGFVKSVIPEDPKKEIWPLLIEKAFHETFQDGDWPTNPIETMTGRPPITKPIGSASFDQIKNDFNSGKTMYITSTETNILGNSKNEFITVSNVYADGTGKQWIEICYPGSSPFSVPFEDLEKGIYKYPKTLSYDAFVMS